MYLNVNMPEAMWHKCYVDGIQLHTCFEANEEEGWASYFDYEEKLAEGGFDSHLSRKRWC